ncbi:hypothetical protein D3C76_1805910 [compost metagenome]
MLTSSNGLFITDWPASTTAVSLGIFIARGSTAAIPDSVLVPSGSAAMWNVPFHFNWNALFRFRWNVPFELLFPTVN